MSDDCVPGWCPIINHQSSLITRLAALCALVVAASASAAIPPSERDALIAVYNASGGSGWTNKTNWLGAAGSECSWAGVQCNFEQTSVEVLYLFENNLTGTISPEVAKLTRLRSLQLYSNQLTGEIPAALGQMTELRSVFFTNNGLTGRIPSSIGGMTNLEEFQANGNHLTGPLPDSIGDLANLRYLDLSYNEITGKIPDLSRTKLTYLSLNTNQFSGSVPALPATIQSADFAVNELTGTIPAHITTLPELVSLRLSNTKLTGGIPAALAQLKKLEILDLYNTPFGGEIPKALGDLPALTFLNAAQTELSGTIPSELYRLTTLEELYLGQNHLTGQISPDIGKLQNLVKLGLNGNQLSGPIPVALTTLSKLDALDLLVNNLSGPIPPEIGRLQNLTYIDIAANEFTGTIPPQFGDLSKLTFLSVYNNDLEGGIPPELGKLSELQTLYVGGNRLTGAIPDALRSLKKLTRFSTNGNLLTGNVPSWIGELTALEELDLSENHLTGSLPAGLAALENLGILSMSSNELTGPLPDFRRLTNVRFLFLNNNQLSGRIPESVGAMKQILYFALGNNALTGPLPHEIGNFTSAEYFDVSTNFLSGEIPREIGQLKTAYNVSLHENRFTGAIPRELGDLSENLQELGLSFNALRGPIPSEITKLTRIANGHADFSYNALTTSSEAVRAFVNAKQGSDFEDTQTVPPTNVQTTATTDRSATLTWTPIRYDSDPGGYQVVASKTAGGAPAAIVTTPTKEDTTVVVRNLEPSTRYFFTVSTVTHPHYQQDNLIVSDPVSAPPATTTERVVAPAEVVISELPQGLVQVDGVEVVGDHFTLTNFGDLPATVQIERSDEFFTIEPASFALAGGASRTVTIKSVPQQPLGTQWGNVVVRGQGVSDDTSASVVLLSVKRPTGSVIAQPVATTIELAGAPGSDEVGVAQFRNAGTAELSGIVVSDQPWVVPDPQPITISPGSIGSVTFRVVRSKRPAGADGALTASLSLIYVDGSSGSRVEISDTGGVSVSKVTVIDTTKPPVTTGSIPVPGPGELPLFIPGIASTSSVRTDVSLVNAFSGLAIGDLKLYFSAGAATSIASLQPLKTSEAVNLVNIAGNVYGVSNGTGTLQIRSRSWSSIGTDAKVTAVTPSGTYSGAIPVFRGDRSLAVNERIYLAGVMAGGDVFIQETGGTDSRVAVEFLDASGNAVGTARSETVAAYALRELRGVVPANAATAVVTNGGSGAITAYARNTDPATGDSWSIVDWSRFYRYSTEEPMRVPFADGKAAGGGGKKRSVRSLAATARAATDLVLFNPSASEARATMQLVAADGSTADRSLAVPARTTITLRDVGATTSSATAHVVITPLRGALVVTARSHAGAYGTAVPVLAATQGLRLGQSQVFSSLDDSSAFKTGYGLVETSDAPITVRARILIGETNALVTATTTRTFNLSARQQVYLPELLRSFAGDNRGGLGDLHDLTLEFEVIGGDGSVVPFLIVTDNGTGDSVMKVQ